MDPKQIALGMLWYIAFLFSTTCHEAAHAWAAMRGGDSTALEAGQVSLNPIPHMRREKIGTIAAPIVSYLLMGWMIGWASAPYNAAWERRYPKRAGWMALAGPAANMVLAVLSGLILSYGIRNGTMIPTGDPFLLVTADPAGGLEGVAAFLSIVFVLNLLLAVFNLFPVPPLDGATVLALFVSEPQARVLFEKLRSPTVSMMGFLLAWYLFPVVFSPVLRFAAGFVYGT